MTRPRFDRYALVRTIGRGASSTVVEAVDEETGARVALKVPHAGPMASDVEAEMGRQVEISRAIASPHVVAITGVAREGYQRALVLERVDGVSLDRLLEGGGLPWEEVHAIALDAARGLSAIHGAAGASGGLLGLVHGDVSPSNVLIDVAGRAKLTDLGLATRRAVSVFTQSGAVEGTAGYIAPEVVRGLPPGSPADVFALGAVLFEALSGGPAFEGTDGHARLLAAVERSPEVPASPLTPSIEACLRKRAEARPEVPELVRMIERVEGGGAPARSSLARRVRALSVRDVK